MGGGGMGGGGAGGAGGRGGGAATQANPSQGGQPAQQALKQLPHGESEQEEKPGGGAGRAVLGIALLGGLGLLLLTVVVAFFPLFMIAGVVGGREASRESQETCSGTECTITGDIPAAAVPFKEMYANAAKVYGVNPYLLMAVHEDETNYGTSTAPGVRDGVNFANCCAGPMQFLIAGGASNKIGGRGGTWAGYATAYEKATMKRPARYPNRYDPHPNVYDSFDAIYAAAKYFGELGAGPVLDERTYRALLSYKGTPPHSVPFAQADYARAKELERLARQTSTNPIIPVGPRGTINPRTGDAIPPPSAPKQVKGIYRAANNINRKDYLMFHFPTHINSPAYDCSSSTSHALWGGGLMGVVPQPSGSFASFGRPGPGKWVTIWYKPGAGELGHVYLVVAGLRFDTSHSWAGDNAIPATPGPRWTANLAPVAQLAGENFYPRHPPGL